MKNKDSDSEVSEWLSGNENDLALLACKAAIEVDNILLGRGESLIAVQSLAQKIAKFLPPAKVQLIDPTTVMMIKYAIDDSIGSSTPLTTMPQLVHEAEEIRLRLTSINGSPNDLKLQNEEDLKAVRSFCLALSKHAAAQSPSLYSRRSDRPFRR